MERLLNSYKEQRACIYKNEHYSVRDNGAVLRHTREGKRMRKTMRKWLLLGAFFALSGTLFAQTPVDSVSVAQASETIARYKLYPTNNMWTFLKLDTRTGRIWQVQWSLESDKRFESVLSRLPLTWDSEGVDGRFELYRTSNTFNFVMLDRINGNTYQVQWSQEADKRFVVPIG